MNSEVKILKDWGDLIAVFKPAGWLTIPGRGNKQDVPVLFAELAKLLKTKGKNDLFVIHRLDEGTSGVVLFARTAATHKLFSQKFENGEVKKTYIAVVVGEPANQIVDQPILKLPSKKNKSVVSPKGKSSQTILKKKEQRTVGSEAVSLLEITPLTGRSHQIRVHLAHLGFPILGDKLYGGKTELNGKILNHPLLHAQSLEFKIGHNLEKVESEFAFEF